ncbi:hypothetical protein COO60DRAFT_1701303 [Scenedesmus sp. NREL 46B-D3]|nr:hypothetical protein COO60DRAFT_1701303 [Scenedesmus sp. NREL 46B-D3]
MPGAQATQPQGLARLVRLAGKRGHHNLLQHVIQRLPAAQQLPSRALCGALLCAGAASQRWLVRQLAGLQAAQQLAPGDALWLLQQLMQKPMLHRGLGDMVEDVVEMDLGSQLTGAELLQLLHQAAQHGGVEGGMMLDALVQLYPAAHDIEDVEGYAAFLQAAMGGGIEPEALESATEKLPVTEQLPPEIVAGCIQQCIRNSFEDMYTFLLEHVAVDFFSTDTQQQPLLLAAVPGHRCWQLAHVAALLKVPAAAQLSVETVTLLLQHAVQERQQRLCVVSEPEFTFQGEVQHLLLALPAVQQLPAAAVASILAAAAEAGNAAAASTIYALPGALHIDKQALSALFESALVHGHLSVLKALIGNAALLGIKSDIMSTGSSEQRQRVLQLAMSAADSEYITELCECQQASAAGATSLPSISADNMQQLLLAALQELSRRRITAAAARSVFALDDAKAVGAAAAAELLAASLHRCSAAGVELVTLLPATARIDQPAAETPVHDAMRMTSNHKLGRQATVGLLELALHFGHLQAYKTLLNLPQCHQITVHDVRLGTGEQLLRLLQRVVEAGESEGIVQLCQHVSAADQDEAAPGAPAEGMRHLLRAGLQQMDRGRITAAAAEQLFELPGAAAVGAAAVEDLLHGCISQCSAAGVQLVGRLPAAAQLGRQVAEQLVQAAMQRSSGGWSAALSLLASLLQLPAVQRLEPAAVARLLSSGMESQLPQPLVVQLGKLLLAPLRDGLEPVAMRQLLLLAFEEQCWDVFEWRRQLPGAPLDDEQVVVCCNVRGWQLQRRLPY